MSRDDYVHGYSDMESTRLRDQANTLAELLHHDTLYPRGSCVLEAGCGVGAQTVILAKHNPDCRIISMDISSESVVRAKQRCERENVQNVTFQTENLFDLPFEDEEFDHVFVCFVLEHLSEPEQAVRSLMRVLQTGGSFTAIEGDHGSACYHPKSADGQATIDSLVEAQRRLGGDALIGRRLYPLLVDCGLREVSVSPRLVYADASRPLMVEGFTKKTFNAMVEGARDQVIGMKLIEEERWQKGIADLYRTAEEDGTFCYTFFKGVGLK